MEEYQWYNGGQIIQYGDLSTIVIYENDQIIISMEKTTGNMNLVNKDKIEILFSPKAVVLAVGVNCIHSLNYIKQNLQAQVYQDLWAKRPFHIYYDNYKDFSLVLQTAQIDELLQDENSVFFISWENADAFFRDPQSHLVDQVIYGTYLTMGRKYDIAANLKKIKENTDASYFSKRSNCFSWYREHGAIVKQNIINGKPKILFITSRFSTAVQYHIRDCMDSCRKMGCIVSELKEKSDIHCLYFNTYIQIIDEFKPDIIFIIDYFRKKEIMPEEIVHVCWAQDPLPNLFDKQVVRNLDENQYVLSNYSRRMMIEAGYDLQKVKHTSLVANHEIYRPHQFSDIEYKQYEADIVLVGHTCGTIESVIDKFNDKFSDLPSNILNKFGDLLRYHYQQLYNEGIQLNTKNDFRIYLETVMEQYGLSVYIGEDNFEVILKYFYNEINYWFFHLILAEWIIDKKYKKIKIYGKGWEKNPKFKKYAMGAAPNGEVLSKIYQCAKINLALNPILSGATRFYECYLSGGFYIAKYIDPQFDMINFREVISVEIPSFKSRTELYDKIDYYLYNEAKRKKVVELAREEILQYATYEVLMKNMLQWLSQQISNEGESKE